MKEVNNLPERLREEAKYNPRIFTLLSKAADEIDRQRATIALADKAFRLTFLFAEFTACHWDADRDAKVGKCLNALSGHLKKYSPDTDAIHAIADEIKKAAEAAKEE